MIRNALALTAAAAAVACTGASGSGSGSASAAASPPPTTPAVAPAATATAAAPTPPRPADNVITPDGLGPVRIGMSAQDALRVLGEGWRLHEPLEPGDPNACRHIERGTPETGMGPVGYMVENMRITRIEVSTPDGGQAPDVASERGIRIGSTADDVRRAYPQGLEAEGHRYLGPTAQYLTHWTRGGPTREGQMVEDPNARGIRFVTGDDRRVQEIHAGGSAIQYIEGCA